MLEPVEILAAVLVGLSACMGLAHVLELPGKLRLTEAEYRIVQPIYYPSLRCRFFWLRCEIPRYARIRCCPGSESATT